MSYDGIERDKTLELAAKLGVQPVLDHPTAWFAPQGTTSYRQEAWWHATTLHDAVRLAKGRPKVRRRWGKQEPTLASLDGLYLYDIGRIDTAEETAIQAGEVFEYKHGFSMASTPTLLSLRLGPSIRPGQVALDEDELFELYDGEQLGMTKFVLWGSEAEKECVTDGEAYVGFDSPQKASAFRGAMRSCEKIRVADPNCRAKLEKVSQSMGALVTKHGFTHFKIRILPPYRVFYWGAKVTHTPWAGENVEFVELFGTIRR